MNDTSQMPATGPGQIIEPEYETKQELATRLGVSTRTINTLMGQGLPYLNKVLLHSAEQDAPSANVGAAMGNVVAGNVKGLAFEGSRQGSGSVVGHQSGEDLPDPTKL